MNKNAHNSLMLYASDSHSCAYLPDREAVTAFVDPNLDMNSELYGALLDLGFRRSGSQVYRPHCDPCHQCMAARVGITTYRSNRNQRRNLKLHLDSKVVEQPAIFKPSHLDLYNKYMANRHGDSDMGNADKDSFMSFLTSSWCETRFFEFYREQHLFAVAVADLLPNGLSAVYTFFDPKFEKFSPGQYAILWLLDEARRRNLAFLYLGYWIPGCEKMSYKSNYRPLEILLEQTWCSYPRNTDLPY